MRYAFGPFALDAGSRELVRDGRPVPLTPRAFDLLCALVAARPRVLDKAMLVEALWPGTFVTAGSLAQLVTEVRRALGDRARAPRYVRTVFGRGYAFCSEARDESGASGTTPFSLLWQGREVPLVIGENLLGREPEARVRLGSSLASRRHARIVVAGGGAVVEDLGSKNGTYVEGHRLAGARPLAPGDHIAIGEEVMIFCARDAAASTRSDPRRR